jgi:hypothetical protein
MSSEPRMVVVTGSFVTVHHEQPVQGLVRFTPARLWVVCDGITWACLAPEVVVGRDGRFTTYLTATDNDSVPFTYLVQTPAGAYETFVPWAEDGYSLKDLLGRHGCRLTT